MKGKSFAAVAVAASLMVGAAACGSDDEGSSTAAAGSGTQAASSEPVKIGMDIALSGPVSVFSKPFVEGQAAWLDKINAEGGVNGRTIELTVLDDALDVAKAVANTRQLIADGNVAVTNGAGAGTVSAMAPVLNNAKVPFVFTTKTDADMATMPYTFTGIPAYGDQVLGLLAHAFEQDGPGKVAFVGGESGVPADEQGAAKQGTEDGGGTWVGGQIIPIGVPDIAPYAIAAAKGDPDYLVATINSADLARMLTYMAQNDTLPKKGVLAISAVPGDSFLQGIPDEAAEIFTAFSAVAPATDPAAESCNAALKERAPKLEPDMVTLAGCQNAQFLVAMVEAAGDDISPEGIRNGLLSMKDVEASPLSPPLTFTEDDHVGMKAMPVVEIEGGEWVMSGTAPVPFEWR